MEARGHGREGMPYGVKRCHTGCRDAIEGLVRAGIGARWYTVTELYGFRALRNDSAATWAKDILAPP
jgi:hypothetical protein